MSQENVEVVRRVTDLMDAEGFEAALPVFLEAAHPDVQGREDLAWPGAATYRGTEQVRWVGRGKVSGAQGEISMAMVWTVREQAITRVEFFLDRARALEAVGLRE
jgi:hypothetical protein